MIIREIKHPVWCSLDNLLREHFANAFLMNWGRLRILTLLNRHLRVSRVILTLSDHPVNVTLKLGSGRQICFMMFMILLAFNRDITFGKNLV
jgi:hypothetical protein